MFDVMDKYGILGVEMEAAGIYLRCRCRIWRESAGDLYCFRPYQKR